MVQKGFSLVELSMGLAAGTWPMGKLLAPEEAWNIDTKMDDGQPALGMITASKSSYVPLPDCVTSDALDAEYELSIDSKECILVFGAGF